MQCANCGTDNKPGAKFCISCGSSMGVFCPNCGTANTAGAKFCVSCGGQIGIPVVQASMPAQPVVAVRTGIPGWLWALIGILVGILVIGGLIISGILPFDAASTEQASPPLQPVSESPEASSVSIVEPGYCPQTGGVILYWNAGYDCANDMGDPGYRLRYGDGFQDLNTGQFDDQASSIHIPAGWSVRLYENVEKNGASHCFNTSVANFEDFGNFDNRDLLINDNVTSMQVFRDGTCGQDLAEGAEPAPMPEDETPPEGAPGTQAGGCDCVCVEKMLADIGLDYDWRGVTDEFWKDYVLDSYVDEDEWVITIDDRDNVFETIINDPNLQIVIYWETNEVQTPFPNGVATSKKDVANNMDCIDSEGDTLECKIKFKPGKEIKVDGWASIFIDYFPNEFEGGVCFNSVSNNVESINFSYRNAETGSDSGTLDCRDPLVSCPPNSTCVQSKETGDYYCQENKQSDSSSDSSSGSGDGSSSGCTPGCWCEIGGVWNCWQSCAPHCVDP